MVMSNGSIGLGGLNVLELARRQEQIDKLTEANGRLMQGMEYWRQRTLLLVAEAQRGYPFTPDQVIYQLQECEGERDGLHVTVWSCASLEAAQRKADERAGRFAQYAEDWALDGTLTSVQLLPWARRIVVPAQTVRAAAELTWWQHITPTLLEV